MKKLLATLLLALTIGGTASAQFTHYGAKIGFGTSTIGDDLMTKSPILGMNIGGFAEYGFTDAKAFFADNIHIQFGLNFARRGCNFEQVWERILSVRQGYYHAWYAQVPILLGYRFELPIVQPDHNLAFYIGPSFSVGMFGKYWDSQITPGYPQTAVNYDSDVNWSKKQRHAFQHMRRFDIAAVLGVSYQYHEWGLDLFMERGFVPITYVKDVLVDLDKRIQSGEVPTNQKPDENSKPIKDRNAFSGNNLTFTLSLTYRIPFK